MRWVARPWWMVIALGLTGLGSAPTAAQVLAESESVDAGWPRQLNSGTSTFTVYQPQIDSWDADRLALRAAVAVEEPGMTEPEFGVIWVTAHTDVDKTSRMVSLLNLTVTRASFPSAPSSAGDWQARLQALLPAECGTISLDRLEAALADRRELTQGAATALHNGPPEILFSTVPSVLVLIDGDPVLRAAAPGVERVINTRVLLLRSGDAFYLHLFDGWMRAGALTGPWSVAAKPPAALAPVRDTLVATNQVDLLEGTPADSTQAAPSLTSATAPAVLIRTAPAELIVTDGPPDYVPVDSTGLLYVENTTGRVFQSTADNATYVLISGRWFRAGSTAGPWTNVPANRLPPDFSRIPDWSPVENVRASVAGTPQAKEAAIANSIPQTATVQRAGTTLGPAPVVDGEPRYRTIEGTTLQYLANASLPIIRTRPDSLYAVQNGVWFVAGSLRGPWVVATEVPAAIYGIPPSSPLYYVTFVRVYDATEDLVYEGYSPGYLGSILDPTGVVVYGTGYDYDPWIGADWYGAPWTYGIGACVRWTPWTGWGFGFGFGRSWGRGRESAWGGLGWGPRPWWGPSSWWWSRPEPHLPGRGGPDGRHHDGWGGTGGNLYARWNGHGVVTHRPTDRAGIWSGAGRRGQFGAAYNSRTGGIEAGQRAAVRNIESYGRAARAAAPSSGRGPAQALRPAVARPPASERPAGGNAGRANAPVARPIVPQNRGGENNVFAGPDGQVFRHAPGGSWEQRQGHGWQPAIGAPAPTLEGEDHARSRGASRAQDFGAVQRAVAGSSRGGGGGGGSARRH